MAPCNKPFVSRREVSSSVGYHPRAQMTTNYDSSAIEVLTGLEPVRKRPGMYTTTERPNHLAQEVIDNSTDEAIAGYCDEIAVTLHDDGSMSVSDNGRGMPVDKHAKEGVSGVEVILTRLYAGARFSEKNYRFSGGLHGVGVRSEERRVGKECRSGRVSRPLRKRVRE